LLSADRPESREVALPEGAVCQTVRTLAETALLVLDDRGRALKVKGDQAAVLAEKDAQAARKSASEPATDRARKAGPWAVDMEASHPTVWLSRGPSRIPVRFVPEAGRLSCDVYVSGLTIAGRTWLVTRAGILVYRTGQWANPEMVYPSSVGDGGQIKTIAVDSSGDVVGRLERGGLVRLSDRGSWEKSGGAHALVDPAADPVDLWQSETFAAQDPPCLRTDSGFAVRVEMADGVSRVAYENGLFETAVTRDLGVAEDLLWRATPWGLVAEDEGGRIVTARRFEGGVLRLAAAPNGEGILAKSGGVDGTWYRVGRTGKTVAVDDPAGVSGTGLPQRLGWRGRAWRVTPREWGFELLAEQEDEILTWSYLGRYGRFARDVVRDLAFVDNDLWLLTDGGTVRVADGTQRQEPVRRVGEIDTSRLRSVLRWHGRRFFCVGDRPLLKPADAGGLEAVSETVQRQLAGALHADSTWEVHRGQGTINVRRNVAGSWVDTGFNPRDGMALDRFTDLVASPGGGVHGLTPVGIVQHVTRPAEQRIYGANVLPENHLSFRQAERLLRDRGGQLWVWFGVNEGWYRLDAERRRLMLPLDGEDGPAEAGVLCDAGPLRWFQPEGGPARVVLQAADGSTAEGGFLPDGRLAFDAVRRAAPVDEDVWLSTPAGLQRLDPLTATVRSIDSRESFRGPVRFRTVAGVLFARGDDGSVYHYRRGTWQGTSAVETPFDRPRQFAIGALSGEVGDGGVRFSLKTEDGEVPVRLDAGGVFEFQRVLDALVCGDELVVVSRAGLWVQPMAGGYMGDFWPLDRSPGETKSLRSHPDGGCVFHVTGGEALRYVAGEGWSRSDPLPADSMVAETRRWQVQNRADGRGHALRVMCADGTFRPAGGASGQRGFAWQHPSDVAADPEPERVDEDAELEAAEKEENDE
jgi:hypothetical protein